MLIIFFYKLQGDKNKIIKIFNKSYYAKYFITPGFHNFTVPNGVNQVFIKMWGSGGSGSYNNSGGAGGYSSRFLNVISKELFGIEVGSPNIYLKNNWGGYPPAGGRSSIFINNNLLNELMVAGGGGVSLLNCLAGAGGGLNGQNSLGCITYRPNVCSNCVTNPTGGGTQTSGGFAGTSTYFGGHYDVGVSGGRNKGSEGHGDLNYYEGGSGGGGYYGGGSGGRTAYCGSGGGGGSGYISPKIINGITLTGNFNISANFEDELRENFGNSNFQGVVIIMYEYNSASMSLNLILKNLLFCYQLII